MYRTATCSIYDILDEVFINVRVLEYSSTPGTLPPREFIYSTSLKSTGEPDPQTWAMRALSEMAAELNF